MATTQGYPRKDRIPLHLAVTGSCISQSDEEQSFEYIELTVHSMAEHVRRSIARSRVAPIRASKSEEIAAQQNLFYVTGLTKNREREDVE